MGWNDECGFLGLEMRIPITNLGYVHVWMDACMNECYDCVGYETVDVGIGSQDWLCYYMYVCMYVCIWTNWLVGMV